jgi:hypothetical protein
MNSKGSPSHPSGSQPTALTYWRLLGAESFDERLRAEVAACVAGITSTVPAWRRAIRGDPAAAAGLVLQLKSPPRISARVDLAMTVLLNSAFESAGAALVLSHALRLMPLDPRERTRLATSWLVYNVWLEQRRRGRRVLC